MTQTPIEAQTAILADLWMTYRDDEEFTDLFDYGDLAFPLAYAISTDIVKQTPKTDGFISEIFKLLLDACGIEEDTGFDSLEDILGSMI